MGFDLAPLFLDEFHELAPHGAKTVADNCRKLLVKIALRGVARHDEFVFRWDRYVDTDAKRASGSLVLLGLFDSNPAAHEIAANPLELCCLLANQIFYLCGFAN